MGQIHPGALGVFLGEAVRLPGRFLPIGQFRSGYRQLGPRLSSRAVRPAVPAQIQRRLQSGAAHPRVPCRGGDGCGHAGGVLRGQPRRSRPACLGVDRRSAGLFYGCGSCRRKAALPGSMGLRPLRRILCGCGALSPLPLRLCRRLLISLAGGASALSPSGRPRSRSAVPRPCLPSLLSFLRPKELRLHRLSMSLDRGRVPGCLFFPRAADAPARSVLLPDFWGRRNGLLPRTRLHIRLRPGALHGTVRDAAGLLLQGLLHAPAHPLLELLRRLTGRPLQSRSLSHRRRRSILPGLLPVGQLLLGHDPRH